MITMACLACGVRTGHKLIDGTFKCVLCLLSERKVVLREPETLRGQQAKSQSD